MPVTAPVRHLDVSLPVFVRFNQIDAIILRKEGYEDTAQKYKFVAKKFLDLAIFLVDDFIRNAKLYHPTGAKVAGEMVRSPFLKGVEVHRIRIARSHQAGELLHSTPIPIRITLPRSHEPQATGAVLKNRKLLAIELAPKISQRKFS